MTYDQLLAAKKTGREVTTPYGVGGINGIGLTHSYVAIDDPNPQIIAMLYLVPNEDIKEKS